MVRCGIALYGCDPMNVAPEDRGLEPALELSSATWRPSSAAAPGDSAGYGRRFVAERDTWLATIPIGYADGIRRALSGQLRRADRRAALPAGRHGQHGQHHRRPRAGPAARVAPEAPVTLIGRDGAERQTVEELANAMGSIAHEMLCGISARVTRELPPRRRAGGVSDPLALLPGARAGAWLVGGAVRDGLLGRATSDYDVVVPSGDADGRAVGASRATLGRSARGHRLRAVGRVRRVAGGRS